MIIYAIVIQGKGQDRYPSGGQVSSLSTG